MMHSPTPHDSAALHVSGSAPYVDDIVEPADCLHAYLGLSLTAHGTLTSLDLSAVRNAPGVVAVLTAKDLPGPNDISPTHRHDEPIFAENIVEFHGQPLFAVIAETRDQARRAAKLADVKIEALAHAISAQDGVDAGLPLVTQPLTLAIGKMTAPRLTGTMEIGGQDHFYLETHISLVIPEEAGGLTVHCSTQHPTEVQHMVASALGVPASAVAVQVRRMGGGFGGKETQSNLFAVVSAIAATKLGRAVKLRPDRDDDMIITGKRHEFSMSYGVDFDDTGRIRSLEVDALARCGYSSDLSGPITDRALFHIDNCYHLPAARLCSRPQKTHTLSNTAFRGFGGPQGMLLGERVIEEIAYATGQDPLDVRKRNFYGAETGHTTPYHQNVEDSTTLHRLVEELEQSSNYRSRRAAIIEFNAASPIIKRGIALTPVKFGISFTATWYNQAGALIHIYQDGTVHLNHGGTEMGQGLNIKVAQVTAQTLDIPLEWVRVTATRTDKVPNTSATAASSGSDLNGMAARNAAAELKTRLDAFIAEDPARATLSWPQLVKAAYFARVQLSATGFYKTPKIHWDRTTGTGHPFYYFAWGAACSEVEIDSYTGENRVLRTDILHDVGQSLNPAIDLGQIEGGFVQGLGWLTTEELVWDKEGRLRTHAPSTYKIPLASDRPREFNVQLADWASSPEPTIGRSKAVGEPPFMLAFSVLEALSMAVASHAKYRVCPRLNTPATPERILFACERLKAL